MVWGGEPILGWRERFLQDPLPGRTGSCPSRVMSVTRLSSEETNHEPKRVRVERPLVMGFLDENKIGTIQPHDDALVITLRIGCYDVKRVMVD